MGCFLPRLYVYAYLQPIAIFRPFPQPLAINTLINAFRSLSKIKNAKRWWMIMCVWCDSGVDDGRNLPGRGVRCCHSRSCIRRWFAGWSRRTQDQPTQPGKNRPDLYHRNNFTLLLCDELMWNYKNWNYFWFAGQTRVPTKGAGPTGQRILDSSVAFLACETFLGSYF